MSHGSVTWAVGQASPMYCRYIPGGAVGTKLYCLVTEGRVCEQLAQGRYPAVYRAGIKPGTSGSPVRHATVTPPSHVPSHTESLSKRHTIGLQNLHCRLRERRYWLILGTICTLKYRL